MIYINRFFFDVSNQFRKFLREKGIPSDEVLKNPQYAKLWKYKNDDGEVV